MMTLRSMRRGRRVPTVAALGVLAFAMLTMSSRVIAADDNPYPQMAPISQYTIASRAEEMTLAKSAAPASISDAADVLVLGAHGYEKAASGTNGFVCIVVRSWDVGFDDPQFWNPKVRSPQCFNAISARSVLPRYLTRTERVLAGVSKAELEKREVADRAAGKIKAPDPGGVCYMLSKNGYLNDAAGGPWHPHFMLFAPRTDDAAWGANVEGSPVNSDSHSYPDTTIFFVIVPNWSDGTPAPLHSK